MYFNHYAVQVKRLQQLVPTKEIKFAGRIEEVINLLINGKLMTINKEEIRTQASLINFAEALKQ